MTIRLAISNGSTRTALDGHSLRTVTEPQISDEVQGLLRMLIELERRDPGRLRALAVVIRDCLETPPVAGKESR